MPLADELFDAVTASGSSALDLYRLIFDIYEQCVQLILAKGIQWRIDQANRWVDMMRWAQNQLGFEVCDVLERGISQVETAANVLRDELLSFLYEFGPNVRKRDRLLFNAAKERLRCAHERSVKEAEEARVAAKLVLLLYCALTSSGFCHMCFAFCSWTN